ERAECLVEVQRRCERAGAAVCRLEDVDATPELVAQRLRLACPRLRDGGLVAEPPDEPADDRARDQEDAERERDAIPDKPWSVVEMVNAPPPREHEEGEEDDRHHSGPDQAEAQRAPGNDENQRPARRASE